jgi:intracellular sulfur oxidation DsrE/DsrF family protein
MRKMLILSLTLLVCAATIAQPPTMTDAERSFKRDSTLKATYSADSTKIAKQYSEMEKWDKLKARAQYPLIKGGDWSGIIPVSNVDEIPDPKQDYKLLFELTEDNPDSLRSKPDGGLTEVARVINLHVASGIPANKIMPVLVIHGGALHAVSNNGYYQEHYKMENPNLKLINDLKNVGAKFIICGQAMNFLDMKKEEFLPEVKLSLTAQTVLSNYQLKGYVKYSIGGGK